MPSIKHLYEAVPRVGGILLRVTTKKVQDSVGLLGVPDVTVTERETVNQREHSHSKYDSQQNVIWEGGEDARPDSSNDSRLRVLRRHTLPGLHLRIAPRHGVESITSFFSSTGS